MTEAASMYFWSVSLVDQLSGQFHIFLVDQFFFGRPKTNFSFFWSTNFFWSTKNHFLMFLVDQFFFWSTKFIFSQPKKKLVNQKKWEIDRTIGRPRDWSKAHGCRYTVFSNWKMMAATNLSDYLGLKRYKKAKKWKISSIKLWLIGLKVTVHTILYHLRWIQAID